MNARGILAHCCTSPQGCHALEPRQRRGQSVPRGSTHHGSSSAALVLLSALVIVAAAVTSPARAADAAPRAVADKGPAPPAPYEAHRVVADGRSWFPVFSPDGRSLAYLTLNEEGTTVLLGVAQAGKQPRVVAQLVEPTGKRLTSRLWRSMYCFPMLLWAPDGKSVYFLAREDRTVVCGGIDLATGERRDFGRIDKPRNYSPRQFEFGPDGRPVVSFVYRGEGAPGARTELAPCEGVPLAVFDPAGDGKTVTRTDGPYRRFLVTPDRKGMIATTPFQVWRLDERYQRREKLIEFEDPEDVRRVLFAGGRIIVVIRPNPNKRRGDYSLLAGGKLTPLRSSNLAFDQMAALPDGRLLWAEPPGQAFRIEIGDWTGGTPTFRDTGTDLDGLAKLDQFCPSPDGRRVVAMLTPKPAQETDPRLRLMGFGIGGMSPFHMNPKLTKRLLLLEPGRAATRAVRIDLPGEGKLLLTERDAVAWSPDGRRAAFVRTLTNHLERNMDATPIGLMPCEFLSRGDIWTLTFPDGK